MRLLRLAALLLLAGPAGLRAAALEPLVYTIRVPAPETHQAEVEVRVPTGGRPRIELRMATWSPGYYRVESYAQHVRTYAARTEGGTPLPVGQSRPNRWTIDTGGADRILFSYTILAPGGAVTANVILPEYGVFNGPPTFVTLVEPGPRPVEVRLELPPQWRASATALDPAPDGAPHHYVAPDFDTLADSPLVAGDLRLHEIEVGGARHQLVDFGEVGRWDGAAALAALRPILEAHRRQLAELPFRRYVFLNAFRPGRGGLEHRNSTLFLSEEAPAPTLRWLNFVSHEYFHAFNVKRLRPVELGPFDYENPPSTPSLWFSEGVTSYFAELAVARAGLAAPLEFLDGLSQPIRALQTSPGRLVQTLAASSLDVWNNSTSGIGGDRGTTVSYYGKGQVLGFLLEAHIQKATNGARTFGDAFRLAYRRYGGATGFTPAELEASLSEGAGTDLRPFLHRAVETTGELDYGEALEWFGLRFAAVPEAKAGAAPEAGAIGAAAGEAVKPVEPWTLEIRPDATPQQKERLARLLQG